MIKGSESKQYPIPDEGHYTLVLTTVKDKPQVMTPYGVKDKIAFGFELVGTNDDGRPMMVWQDFYASLGKPAKPSKLAKVIEKILGRRLSPGEYRDGFDEKQLLKSSVEADIVHNQSVDGTKTYANIDELYKNKPQKGAPFPAQQPEVIEEDDEVPF